MALLLYLIFLLLTFRNPYNTHVATDYIGWMLLLCVIVPAGEACAVWPKQMPDWKMSRIIIFGAWLILAAGYCRSGYVKLSNPYWRDGTALLVILQNPFGGGAFLQQIFSSYPILCKLCTWSVLGLELLSLPLCFFRLGRWIVWTGMLAMHFGIFVLMAISTIPLVMGAFHVLTFPSWAQLAISGTTKKPNPQAH
jgi:hypothetical protein